jgi:hypothetical protein
MPNQIEEIENSISGKRTFKDVDEFIVRMHHEFCKNYGWISVDEFINMPVGCFLNLVEELEYDAEREKKEMEKLKNKGKRRR